MDKDESYGYTGVAWVFFTYILYLLIIYLGQSLKQFKKRKVLKHENIYYYIIVCK